MPEPMGFIAKISKETLEALDSVFGNYFHISKPTPYVEEVPSDREKS